MSSIDGLITGIDTTTIIDGLLQIQKSQVDRLELRKKDVADEQAAFKGLEARLLSFRSSLGRLAKSRDGVFDQFIASTSDEDSLQATASPDAQPGIYRLKVAQLATAQQIASQSFSDVDAEVTTGDITFQVGNRQAVTVTVDSENNSVQGLATAINSASDDIQASVINEGGSVRLLLSSNHTGAENQITVTNNLAASGGSATQPDFSGPSVQDATDAQINFGSGAGAITIASSTNQVEDLVEGVTLNLTEADATKEITVSIENDVDSAKVAIENFVADYNDLMTYIDDQTKYIPETDVSGVLLGNSTVRDIQNDVRGLLSRSIGGAGDNLKHLAAIGIQFDAKGQLTINSAELDKVLGGQKEGVDIADVKKLFALTGESSNQKVEFLLGSSATVSGPATIEVDITQAATRATTLGTNAIASSIVIDGSNNTFQFTIDGLETGDLTLLEGTYTQAEFASLVEDTINSNPSTSSTVIVSVESNQLRITSESYGDDSEIADFSGTAIAALGYDGSESDTGTNVEGSFIVNGQTETATGRGRLLTGDSENATTADLQLRILLTDADVVAGPESDLTITRGYAAELDQILDKLLDTENGRLKFENEGYEQRIDSIDTSIDLVNEISEAKQQYLIAQFTALESAIASLQNTGSLLATQLGSLNN